MADNRIYYIKLRDIGAKTFTMPDGFESSMEIHCWGAGGGSGRGGARGGGGGYAKTTININPGDRVSLQLGQPGTNGSYPTGGLGGVDPSFTLFRGGNSSNAYDEDADTGAGGGGGGASWVSVNGVFVCVGAGGGGAGGLGDDASGGNPGLPGGVTTNGLSSSYAGGDAPAGWSTGGGGGGGYPFGGAAGASYGDDAPNPPAGSGGQNYGNVTVAGSGTTPGGGATTYYPGERRGEAGYPGYIILVLRKKLRIAVKNPDGSGNWVNLSSMYYKLPTQTTMILSAPTEQTATLSTVGSGQWIVPDNVTSIKVTTKGAGGGGGGGHSPCSNSSHKGGTGGAGYVTLSTISVSPGQVINYTVGVGGAGGAKGSPGATGGTGGTTTFGSVSAAGGTGGTGGSGNGAGTNGTGGDGRTGGTGGAGDPGESNGTKGSDGLIQLSWTPNAIYIPTVTSGWKQIQQAWVKVSGLWKPLLVLSDIVLNSISAIPKTQSYSTAGTYTFTVGTGIYSVSINALGGGGGGGGGHDPCSEATHYGGAGGGGYTASTQINVTAGDIITFTVGDGGAGGLANSFGSAGTPSIIQLNSVEILRVNPGQGGAPGTGGTSGGPGRKGSGGTGGNGGAGGLGFGSPVHTGSNGGPGKIVLNYTIYSIN